MKRCPECRRDYYDDSLLYCLEDRTTLGQGSVESPDEPRTGVLHTTDAPGEAATKAQIHTTSIPDPERLVSSRRHFPIRLITILAAGILVLGGGFLAYRYFNARGQINSIAVMPFVNESGNADVEYLSDGMT